MDEAVEADWYLHHLGYCVICAPFFIDFFVLTLAKVNKV
jgi:hypothetical protein